MSFNSNLEEHLCNHNSLKSVMFRIKSAPISLNTVYIEFTHEKLPNNTWLTIKSYNSQSKKSNKFMMAYFSSVDDANEYINDIITSYNKPRILDEYVKTITQVESPLLAEPPLIIGRSYKVIESVDVNWDVGECFTVASYIKSSHADGKTGYDNSVSTTLKRLVNLNAVKVLICD